METKCSLVSEMTKQRQEVPESAIRHRWKWTELSVWTDKMLTSLEYSRFFSTAETHYELCQSR